MEEIQITTALCTELRVGSMDSNELAELAATGHKEAIAELKRRGLIQDLKRGRITLMPYKVATNVEGCSAYAVIKPNTGELVACHASKAKAAAHVRALYANVPDAVSKATSEKLLSLYEKLNSEELSSSALVTHHYITAELTKRGLDFSKEETFNKMAVLDTELTFDGIELEELFEGEEDLIESYLNEWEDGDNDSYRVAFGLTGDGVTTLVEPVVDEIDKAADSDTFIPPASVARAAKRALNWIREGHAGGGFTDVGRARAAQLAARRPISLRTIRRMNSFLARHESDKAGKGFTQGEEGFPSAGRVAWDAWGGDAAKGWVSGIINRTEKSLSYEEPFMKADERKFTLGPLYIPNRADAHSEWTDSDELQTAVWEYVKSGDRRIRLQHNRDVVAGEWLEVMTFPYELSVPMMKADGTTSNVTYPANTVFMGVQWKDWAWELVKAGKLRGYSIGGKAQRISADLPEPEEVEVELASPDVSSVHVDTIMKPSRRKKRNG